MAPEDVTTVKDLLSKAETAEAESNYEEAAELYENAIKADPLNQSAYDRLMIVYRKLKEYKKELHVINAGIKAYQQFYKSRATKSKKVA